MEPLQRSDATRGPTARCVCCCHASYSGAVGAERIVWFWTKAFISYHASILDLIYTIRPARSGKSGGISDSESWYGIAQARAIAKAKETNGVFHFSLMRTSGVFGHRGE